MPLNSVNTNIAAQVALQSLNKTTDELQATQKRVSTGYRVADAVDDGAAFAIAQRVRADTQALTTVNQQLGNAKGLIGTSLNALTSISKTLGDAKSLLVSIADASITQTQRDQYVASYKTLVQQVANTVDGATYNGQTLLGKAAGAVAGASKTVINNESGATSTLNAADVSTLANTLATLIGSTFTRTTAGVDSFATISAGADQTAALTALSALSGASAFSTAQTSLSNLLNQTGADSRFLDQTITLNSQKIDSLNAGLGALVDADLSKESARLQALQIRQQLGTQALSLANQAPQALLSLFKG
jgi:flagellin